MRALRTILYLAVLFALIFYGAERFPRITLAMCLADPQRYDGAVIHVGNETGVSALDDSSFTILYFKRPVHVGGTLPQESVGKFVHLNARFIAPDRLQALQVRVAAGRRWKIVLSIFPALLIVGWFFWRFRFSFAAMAFEERRCPTS